MQKQYARIAVVAALLFLGVGALVQLSRASTDNGISGNVAEVTAQQPVIASVSLGANGPEPGALTLAPGTVVEWVNDSGAPRTITFADDNSTDPLPELAPGASVTMTFNQAGSYAYTVSGLSQTGTLTVR